MALDAKLLEILACPEDKGPLLYFEDEQVLYNPRLKRKYEIRDAASPSVRGWIVVVPKAAAVAYPDRKGEFAMDLEPGKYKLRGYFNGDQVLSCVLAET